MLSLFELLAGVPFVPEDQAADAALLPAGVSREALIFLFADPLELVLAVGCRALDDFASVLVQEQLQLDFRIFIEGIFGHHRR